MTDVTYVKDKLAYKVEEGDFIFQAWYLKEPASGLAAVHITREGELVKAVLWPAYKIWNIAAHAHDIIRDIEEGLRIAGSTGLGGNVYTGTKFNLVEAEDD